MTANMEDDEKDSEPPSGAAAALPPVLVNLLTELKKKLDAPVAEGIVKDMSRVGGYNARSQLESVEAADLHACGVSIANARVVVNVINAMLHPPERRTLLNILSGDPVRTSHAYGSVDGLPFVDRDVELMTVWRSLLKTQLDSRCHSQSWKPVLIVTGQMFGSGKTYFATNLLNFRIPHISAVFNRHITEVEFPNRADLLAAMTLSIDCTLIRQIGISLNETLARMLFEALLVLYLVPYSEIDELWADQATPHELVSLVQRLQLMTGRPLFVHVDEVGAIEAESLDVRWTSVFGARGTFERYYSLWNELVALQKQGCFVYVTGKLPGLWTVGRGLDKKLASPGEALHLTLSCFDASHIEELLRVTGIAALLGHGTPQLANELRDYTGGVPRLVQYALDGVKQGFQKREFTPRDLIGVASQEELDALLRNYVFRASEASISSLMDKLGSSSSTLTKLLSLAARGVLLREDAVIDSEGHGLLETAARHSVFVSSVKAQPDGSPASRKVRLVLPGLWLLQLGKLYLDGHVPGEVAAAILDPGEVFEVLIKSAICQHIEGLRGANGAVMLGDALQFLKGTAIEGRSVQCPVKVVEYRRKVVSSNQNERFQAAIAQLPAGCLFRFARCSMSADWTLLLQMAAVGIQVKNYSMASTLDTRQLVGEIEKFAPFANLLAQKAGTQGPIAVFVVICTNFDVSAVREFGGRVLRPGTVLQWEQGRGASRVRHKFQIPSCLEVLVLSEAQVRSVLSDADLALLEHARSRE